MQNAQALDHANGLAKYVCKYIGKFDEGNYIVLCQDIHSGDWVLGKTHLHNTKIVRSKINEDKAYSKNRSKNHPKGRDVSHFEIRQIIFGHPEVFTNLQFLDISTLPFELRPTNKIYMSIKGEIANLNDDTDGDSQSNLPLVQTIRLRNNLDENQLMTESQSATYRNHDGKSTKYDMISLF